MRLTIRIQEEEAIFKKNPTVGVPEVSKLIDSAISKRQGDRMRQSTYQLHKIFFHISKCLACKVEKTLQLKITKKE